MARLTLEGLQEVIDDCTDQDLYDLAEIFKSIQDKVADFNEHNSKTIQEVRESLGEKRFWEILDPSYEK